MGKVLYCTACTLDGFIADEANSLDWLLEVPTSGDDGSWQAFISRVGAPAMGATTCAWVVEHESLLDRPVHAQMDASGGDSWIVGGGDLVGQFDDAGLLDEIHLGMCPVTLGAGAPLLPRRITSARLSLRSVDQDGRRARLVLDVARR